MAITTIGTPQASVPLTPNPPTQGATSVISQTNAGSPRATAYDWNTAHPGEHIFDSPYDGWALNRGLMALGGVGFWSRFSLTRTIASMVTRIPTDQLKSYAVRISFMRIPGMKPDFARLLQMAYNNQTGGQQPLHNRAPLQWLGQFSASGGINDWLVRGPLVIELNTLALNYGMSRMYTPEVPDATTLGYLAQQALSMSPPPGYGQRPYGQASGAPQAVGQAGIGQVP